MTKNPFTVEVDYSVVRTMSVINNNGSGLAVVLNEEMKYFGLVTDGDIRRAIINGHSPQDNIKEIVNSEAIIGKHTEDKKNLKAKLSADLKAIPIIDDQGYFLELLQFKDLNIPPAKPGLHGNELLYLSDCVLSNWISSQGEYVDRFEKSFSDFIGTKYSLSCSNGTSALHLALAAADIKEGDEVIIPSFTWISTANAVKYVGANPVFVDINRETLNIDNDSVLKVLTNKTRAIIPVHIYGQPADLSGLKELCQKKNIILIEDAAEAHGAEIEGKKVGSIGEMGCFSFFGNKILTTGEGGMVTTNDKDLFNKMKVLRDHGKSISDPYWHEVIGFNYRMTNMQAAVGLAQMERIDEILEDKIRVYNLYLKYLEKEVNLTMPPDNSWSKNIHWLFCVRLKEIVDKKVTRIRRDKIIEYLENNSVGARKFFHPIHLMPPYRSDLDLSVTDEVSCSGICLPSYFGMQEKEIKTISSLLIESLTIYE